MDARDRLIVALDAPSLPAAQHIADRLEGAARWFKVGSELYTAAGPAAVEMAARRGRVFLDMKYHDIPASVAGGVAAAARAGVAMCTVHALGGAAMMRAARDAAGRAAPSGSSGERLRVIGVTLLTSADPEALAGVGLAGSPQEAALRLARLAQAAGLDGVVASPREVPPIRAACGPGFLIVCPGVRPEGAPADDQRRTGTPGEAIAAGADFLVVGRPITRAPDPRAAFEEILRQMSVARLR